MTITYPRDLPDPLRVAECDFNPQYAQVTAASRGGLYQVANVGRDLWTMRYATVLLRETEAHDLVALLHSLRGGQRSFKAWNPIRRYPRAYPNGFAGLTVSGAPFSGSGIMTDVGEQLDTVTLGSVPAGFVLAPGDMMSFAFGSGRQALHRVIEGATANGSGVMTVTVEPSIIPGWTDNAPVLFAKPWAKAAIEASSVSVRWEAKRRASISFSGVQVLT